MVIYDASSVQICYREALRDIRVAELLSTLVGGVGDASPQKKWVPKFLLTKLPAYL